MTFGRSMKVLPAVAIAALALAPAANAALTPYQTAVLANSPVVYYPMDESSGTTANDLSGNSFNASYGVVYDATKTASPSPAITLGSSSASSALNTAAAVTGGHGNGYDPVQLTGSGVTALNGIGTNPFTVQFWFQTSLINTSTTDREDLLDFRGTSPAADLSMQVNNNDQGGLTIFNSAGGNVITTSTNVISANTWYMVTLTRDAGGTMTLYLNGSAINTGTDTDNINTGSSGILAIGNKASGAAHLLDGSLDEFAFYNSALSASTVATLYSTGSGTSVPEPASLSLLALGGIALLARRRKA